MATNLSSNQIIHALWSGQWLCFHWAIGSSTQENTIRVHDSLQIILNLLGPTDYQAMKTRTERIISTSQERRELGLAHNYTLLVISQSRQTITVIIGIHRYSILSFLYYESLRKLTYLSIVIPMSSHNKALNMFNQHTWPSLSRQILPNLLQKGNRI